ncbi:MAG: tRNA(1)(Val) ((37)-N(6))-methyltransferase [Bacteroidota bacterium]|jgi:tRNA1Val (adenine37-N6)-methyltransferase
MAENRSIFQFKQFSLAHGNPGLKITTEACLFGAWSAQFPQQNTLDIGTGCGLLIGMLAQAHPKTHFTGIEIQSEVAELAVENVRNLPNSHIQIHANALADYRGKHDFIICNPPFFINHLKNSDASKNQAMHSDTLSPADLAAGISHLLSPEGKFTVLYPPVGLKQFEAAAKKMGLFLNQICEVKHQSNHETLRIMAQGSFHSSPETKQIICIKEADGSYSAEFIARLKPYYLIFD